MSMQIIEHPTEFHVNISYNRFRVHNQNMIKQLDGARFDWTRKTWVVPLHQKETLLKIKDKTRAEWLVFETPKPQVIGQVKPMPNLDFEIDIVNSENGFKPRPYQLQGIARGLELKRYFNGDEQGLGKAQPGYARIATPEGWKRFYKIEEGDTVFGLDGKPQTVTGVFPQGVCETYRVTFNDNSFADCNLEHVWTVRDQNRRRRGNGWANKTLRELIEIGIEYKTNQKRIAYGAKPILKWEIPTCQPIEFNEKQYVIHPYIMGALLGDGCLTQDMICISIPDTQLEIKEKIEKLLPSNLKLRVNRHPSCPQYYITQNGTTKKNEFKDVIEKHCINVKSNFKFIPQIYLQGSVEQRKELLKGLMDTDGSAKQNRVTYHTVSLRLAINIVELVQSLGGMAKVREYDRKEKGIEYQVNINTDFVPFTLSEKVEQCWKKKRSLTSRYIKSIEKVGKDSHICISVSNKDSLYLTDFYIPTHNTLQSVATLDVAERYLQEQTFPVLVICPASTKINWKREWEMWTGRKAMVLDGKIKDTWHRYYELGMADVFIVNYESLKKYFVKKMPPKGKMRSSKDIVMDERIKLFKSIIIDESHRCKSPQTLQSKLALQIALGKEWIILLSGTPVVNKPIDLFPQLAIMGRLQEFGGRKGFFGRYCEGGRGASNLKELNYFLNERCFFRREKSTVAKDLPEKQRQTILCDITTRSEYNKAKNDFVRFLEEKGCTDAEIARKLRGEIMVKMGELKRISALGKLNEVKEFVEEVIDSGEKLILFCNLKAIVESLQKEFPGAVTVTGSDNTESKQRNIDAFQKNPDVKLIICNIKAAGVGITLTASSRVAFVEYPWTYADCVQCEDRAHRIGQKNNVMCTYFLGNKTIDEDLYKLIQEKRHTANTITGATDKMEMSFVDNMVNLFTKKAI